MEPVWGDASESAELVISVVSVSGETLCKFEGVPRTCSIAALCKRVAEISSPEVGQISLCTADGTLLKNSHALSDVVSSTGTELSVTLTMVAQNFRLVFGDPHAIVAHALQLQHSWVEEVMPRKAEPNVETIGGKYAQLGTLFMPPNNYTGSRSPWSLSDVDEWMFALPRPGTVQGDVLAVFRLHDGRHVYIRALSDYYSGDWAGINIRAYIALELETPERYGMGFRLADILDCMPHDWQDDLLNNDEALALKAWQAVSLAVGDVEKWLVCNEDGHSRRRGNVPSKR